MGIGANIPWALIIGNQRLDPDPSLYISFRRPTLTRVSSVGPRNESTGTDLAALDPAGGQQFFAYFDYIAPVNVGFQPQDIFTVRFGNEFTATCARVAGSTTVETCTTPAGRGRDLSLTPGGTAWGDLQATNGSTALGLGVSYRPPVVLSVTGVGVMASPTNGGALFTVTGTGFGPAGGRPPTVVFGPTNTSLMYTARGCRVQITGGGGSQLQCQTPAGVGQNHMMRVIAAGQPSNFLLNAISYDVPEMYNFTGPAAPPNSARQGGGSIIYINGRNFGPVNSRINVTAYYQTMPSATTAASAIARPAIYRASNCFISIPHVQIQCTVTSGAGTNLQWSVYLDGTPVTGARSAYEIPVITQVQNDTSPGAAVLALTPTGGQWLMLRGSGFGAGNSTTYDCIGCTPGIRAPLSISGVSYGPTGYEYVLPADHIQPVNGSHLRVLTVPGSGGPHFFRCVQNARYVSCCQRTCSFM
jgi:hypothetical protein